MSNVKPRVRVPKKASAGDVVTIKTIISHPMESGQRKDRKTGELIPRQIINKFTATYNDQLIIEIDLDPAVSANPYIEFEAKIPETGAMKFTWVDDDGSVYEEEKSITVS